MVTKIITRKHKCITYITYKKKQKCVQIVLNAQVSQDVGEAWEVF